MSLCLTFMRQSWQCCLRVDEKDHRRILFRQSLLCIDSNNALHVTLGKKLHTHALPAVVQKSIYLEREQTLSAAERFAARFLLVLDPLRRNTFPGNADLSRSRRVRHMCHRLRRRQI